MEDLLAIADIQPEDVHEAIRRTIRAGLDPDVMVEFLSGVDWSGSETGSSEFASMLLNLLNWTTMYSEGELGAEQYVSKLLHLVPTGGKIIFTLQTDAPDAP